MRKYVFGTGLIGAITSGLELLRGLRDEDEPFTWRHALIWLSWGITVALTIGAIVDTRHDVLEERAARAARTATARR
ncbi:MAG TPA: hypothetical protein VJR25_11350 [Microbacterium sp.]|uniref:hypothetical protein n=1 Tax=Microbacterium sp. TaxID=51671 RepID=UPI002B499EDB|nr:hypothetical protein [Microbacterium sp.]HKT57358.1 hypothetical protein [Microbacterium sp.]